MCLTVVEGLQVRKEPQFYEVHRQLLGSQVWVRLEVKSFFYWHLFAYIEGAHSTELCKQTMLPYTCYPHMLPNVMQDFLRGSGYSLIPF